MTEKRFTALGSTHLKDNETGKEYYAPCEWDLLDLLNALDELATGNEEQLLAVMTYLHDKYYDIWEEVNKECFNDRE